MSQDARRVAFPALIAGVLMLVIGVWFEREGVSDSDFYNASVGAFNWIMRIGGVAMLIVAAAGWAGWSGAFVADAVSSGLIGLALGLESLIWLSNGDIPNGVLVLVFCLMFLHSARQSWRASRVPAGGGALAGSDSALAAQKPEGDRR